MSNDNESIFKYLVVCVAAIHDPLYNIDCMRYFTDKDTAFQFYVNWRDNIPFPGERTTITSLWRFTEELNADGIEVVEGIPEHEVTQWENERNNRPDQDGNVLRPTSNSISFNYVLDENGEPQEYDVG